MYSSGSKIKIRDFQIERIKIGIFHTFKLSLTVLSETPLR